MAGVLLAGQCALTQHRNQCPKDMTKSLRRQPGFPILQIPIKSGPLKTSCNKSDQSIQTLLQSLMAKTFPVDSAPPAGECAMKNHTNYSGIAQRMWQRAQGVNLASKFCKSRSNQLSTEYVWSRWPHLLLTGLKGSTTNALVPDTTGKPSGVLCLCLDRSEPNPIHGRASVDVRAHPTDVLNIVGNWGIWEPWPCLDF